MKSTRTRMLVGLAVVAIAAVGTWLALRMQRASKVAEFTPIAEVFMARVEARDVGVLKKLGLDSAGLADALAIPAAQITAIVRGRLRVVSGKVDNDFARITYDTDATFCPANTGHAGRLDIQFIQQGGRWAVDRADPALC